jgi:foldase protein PrsA
VHLLLAARARPKRPLSIDLRAKRLHWPVVAAKLPLLVCYGVRFGAGVSLWYNCLITISERMIFMKIKYLLILALVALLVAACGPQMATPTPGASAGETAEVAAPATAEVAMPAADEETTPTAAQPITATSPITPTGGVEVALAAIKPVDGVLATVGDEEITWADIESELRQTLYGVTLQYGVDWNQAENIALLGMVQDQVLEAVVNRTLLRQLAAKEGIGVSQSDVEARVEEEKTAIMGSGQFSSWDQFKEQTGLSDEYFARLVEDAELIDRVSEAHGPAREVEQVHARHILVADEETGEEVLARLEDGEDWAALAQEYSQDTSNKDDAGDLGWFPRGMMVSEFEEAAFSLETGKTSDLVQTDFGYHIIQVLEKGTRELDDQTYDSMLQQAFQTWLDEQKATVPITVIVTFSSEE